jgi:hypothetical protein
MSGLTPEQRSIRASVAANTRWSREDPRPALAKVREGWQRHWEDEVDPDRVLDPAERERRDQAALRAHMARLSLKSSRARSKRGAP